MTLVELMIATSIAGLAILGGVALLDQLNSEGSQIVRHSAEDYTVSNASRVLLRLLADAQTAPDSAHRFQGNERSATYMTLCDAPGGWREQCRALLALDSLRDSTHLVAQTDRGESFVVYRAPGTASLRYFDLAARDSAWVRQWAPSIALPGAIAIVNGADTVLLPLGVAR